MKAVTVLNWESRRPQREETKYIVVHCSASQPSADIGAQDIHRMHLGRGWSGIGYHYVIRRDGRIERGESVDNWGAHVSGHNTHSVGICLVGGISALNGEAEANYTPEQYGALATALGYLAQRYPDAKVLGHRDLSPDLDGDGKVERHEWVKECPCLNAGAFWKAVKGDVYDAVQGFDPDSGDALRGLALHRGGDD